MSTEIITPAGTRALIRVMANASNTKLPVIIFLHGIDERAINKPLASVGSYGPLKQINDAILAGLPNPIGFDCIVCHPQLPSGNWTTTIVKEVYQHIKTIALVDTDRFYLMGFSLGGLGVWECLEDAAFIKEIAAFVPIACGGNEPAKAHIIVNEGIPGWAGHAVDDARTNIGLTTRMVNAVNDLAGKSQVLFSCWGLFGHSVTKFLHPAYGVYKWLSYQNLQHRAKPVINQYVLKIGEQLIIKGE